MTNVEVVDATTARWTFDQPVTCNGNQSAGLLIDSGFGFENGNVPTQETSHTFLLTYDDAAIDTSSTWLVQQPVDGFDEAPQLVDGQTGPVN